MRRHQQTSAASSVSGPSEFDSRFAGVPRTRTRPSTPGSAVPAQLSPSLHLITRLPLAPYPFTRGFCSRGRRVRSGEHFCSIIAPYNPALRTWPPGQLSVRVAWPGEMVRQLPALPASSPTSPGCCAIVCCATQAGHSPQSETIRYALTKPRLRQY